MGTVHEALTAATDAIRAAGIEEAHFEAEVLLEHATELDRARLAAEPELELPAGSSRRFGEMVRRRLRREPVAYIVGAKWFRHIELAVDPRVLIPRPETEMLVELALELAPATALDVGTGSGAIALAIAEELPECEVTATDVSSAALEVARENAQRLGLADRVRFLTGTVPEGERFDLVLANLPYVADGEWSSLQPEVTEWEPREALLAGPDGLQAIRGLISRLRSPERHVGEAANAEVGALALEVGGGQAPAVAELLREAGFGGVQVRKDLTGIERVVLGTA